MFRIQHSEAVEGLIVKRVRITVELFGKIRAISSWYDPKSADFKDALKLLSGDPTAELEFKYHTITEITKKDA